MDATTSQQQNTPMQPLIKRLNQLYPLLIYKPGKIFCWSPETNEIFYKMKSSKLSDKWSLLHETGHAVLKHSYYKGDFELIKMEVAAWQEAKIIAQKFKITVDEDYIEDCIDTYRDWLHKRSICPNCKTKALQQDDFIHYRCFNCQTIWKVSDSRFCRAYRSTKKITQENIFQLKSSFD